MPSNFTLYRTCDSVVHPSLQEAKKYLEEKGFLAPNFQHTFYEYPTVVTRYIVGVQDAKEMFINFYNKNPTYTIPCISMRAQKLQTINNNNPTKESENNEN